MFQTRSVGKPCGIWVWLGTRRLSSRTAAPGSSGWVPDAFEAFLKRREERCRLVVDSSIEVGRLEQARALSEAHTAVVERVLLNLTEPV